jgi:hypothetical protein
MDRVGDNLFAAWLKPDILSTLDQVCPRLQRIGVDLAACKSVQNGKYVLPRQRDGRIGGLGK